MSNFSIIHKNNLVKATAKGLTSLSQAVVLPVYTKWLFEEVFGGTEL